MIPKIGDIVTVKIQDVYAYGVIGNYNDHKIYIDLVELDWKRPIPQKSIPKVGDEIKVIVTNSSDRLDSDFLASVRHLTPDRNPWHDPTIYKIGDEFIGEIDSVNSWGCWARHPKGADVRLMVNVFKVRLKKGQKIALRVISINEKHESIDAEIV